MGVTRRNGRASWLAKTSMSVNGKRAEKSFADKKYGGRSNAKKEAEAWLTQIEADILRGQYVDPHRNKISLDDFKYKVGIVKLNQRHNTKKILEDMGMAVDSHCIWVETDSGYALRKVNVEVEE